MTLSVPQEAIDRVEYMAEWQKSPDGLTFKRQDGTSYEAIAPDDKSEHSKLVVEEDPPVEDPPVEENQQEEVTAR